MEPGSLFQILQGWIDAAEVFLTSDWDTTKFLQAVAACVTIGAGAFGIFQGLRYAESRLSKRILVYLKAEEHRLKYNRSLLIAAIKKPTPGRPKIEPLFSNHLLTKALRQMRWGRKNGAEISLKAALALADEKIGIASTHVDTHKQQKLAAHLLLGAIADSKKDHLSALGHFQDALDIDPSDVEAIQFAGQQLLCVPDARQALTYFERLDKIARKQADGTLGFRARILQARAYYALPQPNLRAANELLRAETVKFPVEVDSLERAEVHELHGDVRRDRGQINARDSYQASLLTYARHSEACGGKEAADGVLRVTKKINEIANVDLSLVETNDGIVATSGIQPRPSTLGGNTLLN